MDQNKNYSSTILPVNIILYFPAQAGKYPGNYTFEVGTYTLCREVLMYLPIQTFGITSSESHLWPTHGTPSMMKIQEYKNNDYSICKIK